MHVPNFNQYTYQEVPRFTLPCIYLVWAYSTRTITPLKNIIQRLQEIEIFQDGTMFTMQTTRPSTFAITHNEDVTIHNEDGGIHIILSNQCLLCIKCLMSCPSFQTRNHKAEPCRYIMQHTKQELCPY